MASTPAEDSRPIAEISQGPSAFESFLDRNQKGLIVLAVLLVLGAGAWVVVRGIKRSAEENAGAALANATGLADLQDVVKKNPETLAAGSAKILIAEEQWKEGQQDAAIETLRAFLSESPSHPAAPTAKASLASRLMQQGKRDEASAVFQEVAADPAARFLAPYALVALGDLAKEAGRMEEAEAFYKRAKDDFGDNPFANSVQQHIDLLKFVRPEEIEAPAGEKTGEAAPEDTSATTPGLDGNPLGDILNNAPAVGGDEAEAPAEAADETPAEPAEGDSN